MIDGRNDQRVKNNLITYNNIWKIATGQGDDYTTGCLLDYNYVNSYYKMIAIAIDLGKQQAIDSGKQQALDGDPKAIQQISLTANLDRYGNATIFFLIEEAKETISDFSQGTVKVLWMSSYYLTRVAKVFDRTECTAILFCFNIISI